ncbi:POLI-like protein [Mya arenaria]|uniref:POLI-like protein n=1 Tax=Mya arenaria TaxID=6604 RepID=A0ABY7DVG5_MYAAR|nr:POLI-like protein [Mya arenaria]
MDSDEEDWSQPLGVNTRKDVSPVGGYIPSGDTTRRKVGTSLQIHRAVIVHIDIDCFYAQVEMLRNPELRTKPLGIQQKYIIVTCNYVARERGLTKLMLVRDAKEKCPDLVLVSGEDLTHYRNMSYKISNFLQKYCPLVERLGFDENFLDITQLVADRIRQGEEEMTVCASGGQCGCGCFQRLVVGSHLAGEIREALQTELKITCCAGVAHNKLLSKLVAGTYKPNQQTTLLPHMTARLLASLNSVRSIPGIGHSSTKRLRELGITTVSDLQTADSSIIEAEFGPVTMETMKNLSQGIDNTPVVAFGAPQTLSDEDSFRKCSTVSEARAKIAQMLQSLLSRLLEDGRTPHTLRVTVRKMSEVNRYNRESRQCHIPASYFTGFSSETVPLVISKLECLAEGLFLKIVDVKQPFHLTLINVAFTNLSAKTNTDIASFFSHRPADSKPDMMKERLPNGLSDNDVDESDEVKNTTTSPSSSLGYGLIPQGVSASKSLPALKTLHSELVEHEGKINNSSDQTQVIVKTKNVRTSGVMKWLMSPSKIHQSDVLSLENTGAKHSQSVKKRGRDSDQAEDSDMKYKQNKVFKVGCSCVDEYAFSQHHPNTQQEMNKTSSGKHSENVEGTNIISSSSINYETCRSVPGCSHDVESVVVDTIKEPDKVTIPDNIDKEVFLSLPADIQQELVTDWKQRKPCKARYPGKVCTSTSSQPQYPFTNKMGVRFGTGNKTLSSQNESKTISNGSQEIEKSSSVPKEGEIDKSRLDKSKPF